MTFKEIRVTLSEHSKLRSLHFTHASRSSHSWLSKQPQLVQSSKLVVASLSCAELGTAQPQLVPPFVSPSINSSVCYFIHISISPYIWPSICLLSVHPSIPSSFCLLALLFAHPSIFPLFYLFTCPYGNMVCYSMILYIMVCR